MNLILNDQSCPTPMQGVLADIASSLDTKVPGNATVTLDVGYGSIAGQPLPYGAAGESQVTMIPVAYSEVRPALVANDYATGNGAAAAALPTTLPINGPDILMTPAQIAAMNLITDQPTIDGYVGFSSSTPFDFNKNVPSPTEIDFHGVALHEITEDMGRSSGILDGFGAMDPLDLTRFTGAGPDYSTTPGGYISADDGASALGTLNPLPYGDPGDWAANGSPPDAFDAFVSAGQNLSMNSNDVTEMHLIGWPGAV